MAKTKKSISTESGAAPKKRAAPSRAKKEPPKAAKAAAPTQAPLVDTTMAAANAARLLAARAKLQTAQGMLPQSPAAPADKESGNFKQLKESLNRPAAHAVSSALGSAFGEHKSNLPPIHGKQKQVAQNQATGIGRVNVPRRTAG